MPTTQQEQQQQHQQQQQLHNKSIRLAGTTTRTTTTTSVGPHAYPVRVIQPCDQQRALEFMREHYYSEEPLTVGIEPRAPDAADEEFLMSNMENGTSIMAIQISDNHECDNAEEIIGAAIAGPKDCHEVDHLFEDARKFGPQSKWGRILEILAVIERDANVFERYGITRALHTHALGVHKNSRGKAIGALIMNELIALARQKNFEALTADCTSVYSARLFERLGMECINVLRYEDYRDADGNQIFKPPAPHDCVKTYAMRL